MGREKSKRGSIEKPKQLTAGVELDEKKFDENL